MKELLQMLGLALLLLIAWGWGYASKDRPPRATPAAAAVQTNRFEITAVPHDPELPRLYLIRDQQRGVEILFIDSYYHNAAAAIRLKQ